MKTTLFALTLITACAQQMSAQSLTDTAVVEKNIHAEIGLKLTGTGNGQVPFWMRSNQFGDIPVDGVSIGAFGSLRREYASSRKKLADWGAGVDAVLYAGKDVKFIPIEAYLKGRLGIFQLKAGRSRDIVGVTDSTLSVGSFALSGNALGIPKVEISVPEFWSVPFLSRVLAFKGAFSYGWMGKVPIQYGDLDGTSVASYFHNASFHARLGKPEWKVNLFAGINHEVIWGSDKAIFGDQYNLSDLDAFWHVITGKKYTKHGLKRDISKIGNHLGAVDLGFQILTGQSRILAYRQFFYDKGALGHLANVKDGLTGLSITNTSSADQQWKWTKFLFEFFYSKNQAGEADSKETPSGPEYYYNHAVYTEGYAYDGVGLGTPLITPASHIRANLPNAPINYFANNRVIAFHFGTEGRVSGLIYKLKVTYSQNYGDYRASDISYWYNGNRYKRDPVYGIFPKVNQFSGIAEVAMPLSNGLNIGAALAVDQGRLLYNSLGGSLKVSKTW